MKHGDDDRDRIERAMAERFGADVTVGSDWAGLDELARSLEHRSHRKYSDRQVAPELLRLLFACALSAPSKSDLQQADIVHVADRSQRQAIVDTILDMPWIMDA